MTIRKFSALIGCIATIAATNAVMAQSQTPPQQTQQQTQAQQQQMGNQMTAQMRDSLIRQLTDSANRATNPTIAQQLRDSVTTLRAMNVGNAQQMQMTGQQGQTTQQQGQTTGMQQGQATSDQRLRVRKDGGYDNNYNNNSPTRPPTSNRP